MANQIHSHFKCCIRHCTHFFSVFSFVCVFYFTSCFSSQYSGAFGFFMHSVSFTSLTALYNHKFYVIFFLFRCAKPLRCIFCVLLLYCLRRRKLKYKHIQQPGRRWIWMSILFALHCYGVCVHFFSIRRHRFPFKSIKIKPHTHTHSHNNPNNKITACVLLFACVSAFVLFVYGYRYTDLFPMNNMQLLSS